MVELETGSKVNLYICKDNPPTWQKDATEAAHGHVSTASDETHLTMAEYIERLSKRSERSQAIAAFKYVHGGQPFSVLLLHLRERCECH